MLAPPPTSTLAARLAALPPAATRPAPRPPDWLVTPPAGRARVVRLAGGRSLALENGLVRRVFRVAPDGATVALDNLMTGASVLRAVSPEASVTLNGTRYAVGGLLGQPDYAWLQPDWLEAMHAAPAALHLVDFRTGPTAAPFAWKRSRRAAPGAAWPPPGRRIEFDYASDDAALRGITVTVCYELYDAVPIMAKWLRVHNASGATVRLNRFESELLATIEPGSVADDTKAWPDQPITVQADYSFIAMDPNGANRAARWEPDPRFTTQVNYELKTPCLLTCGPPMGPDADISDGGTFESYRSYELVEKDTDLELRSLAHRKLYRTVSPWVTENPIIMHLTDSRPEAVRAAVDQCAAVGFEVLILSFGSGFDPENTSPAYMAEMKGLTEYAHAHGVELGGYSLLASRHIDDANDAINPATGKPGGAIFGTSPCLCSEWGERYFAKLRLFFETTGMDLLENDGSYPGDPCASTTHPGHRGLDDSVWNQWSAIRGFYHWCRARGIYLNVPDWYYLEGANKDGMGYREDNWSLPRALQIIHGRQNIYDGTWTKTPSMGWMFVPLTEYHGGGAAATIEPLAEHLDTYSQILRQNLMSGVQACYRGPRLFDAPATERTVGSAVALYKRWRDILESDVVHLRRPDGRDWDGLLHVNPRLETPALAVLSNPLDAPADRTIRLPLRLAGLHGRVLLRSIDTPLKRVAETDANGTVEVRLRLPARGTLCVAITRAP